MEHISRRNIASKELLPMSVSIQNTLTSFRGKRRIKLVCCHKTSWQQRWSRSKGHEQEQRNQNLPSSFWPRAPCFSKPPQQECPQAEAEPAQAVEQGLSQSPHGKAMGSTGVQGPDPRGAGAAPNHSPGPAVPALTPRADAQPAMSSSSPSSHCAIPDGLGK